MKTKIHNLCWLGLVLACGLTPCASSLAAVMGTAFTYQGRLNDGTNPANGRYDFTFTLYDDPASAKIIAGPLTNSRVNVVDGFFTVALDFRGNAFGGEARWLAIAVRNSGGLAFTPLSPRQLLTPTPQALFASDAGDALRLDGQLATAYAPATGSTSYVAKAGDTMTGLLVLEGSQILAHARGPNTAGSWLSLENTDTGGKRWDFISTGSANGGGPGNLLFRQAAVGSVLTLSPAGRVGVGTVGPIAKLEVVDDAGTEPMLIRASSSRTSGSWLALKNTDAGGTQWNLISTGSGNSGGAGNLQFRESGAGSIMTLTSSGRVGVGTDSPAATLTLVSPPEGPYHLIQATGSGSLGSCFVLENTQVDGTRWEMVSTGPNFLGGAGNLLFRNPSSTAIMALTPGGRVGVGTVTPSNVLHVVADVSSGPQPVLRVERGNGPVAQFHHTSVTSSNFIVCTSPIPPSLPEAVVFRVNGYGDVYGQSFNPSSDRNAKENISLIDSSEMLEKVARLPIARWNFKGDDATPHLGPMAQDFHAAFGLGPDDKHIATVDADGVALAAIQGLNQKVEDRSQWAEGSIRELRAENAELKVRLDKMERLLNERLGSVRQKPGGT